MMNLNKQFLYWVGGHFEWNEDPKDGLHFESILQAPVEVETKGRKKTAPSKDGESFAIREITFKEELDVSEKLRFRKYFLRKCYSPETELITLQDVKDIVLFTADPKNLTSQYIDYLHMPTIDNFFRALIVYFQFYFLVYKRLMEQRSSLEIKIKHPDMIELENNIRDDLSDLRSMVSREYCSLLVGARESIQFHHMSLRNGVSLSDRDRRLTEVLIKFSSRIVWYALHKPNYVIIASEIERLIRSVNFNIFDHKYPGAKIPLYKYEKHILTGSSDIIQPRLLTQSPLAKEVIFADHDYRMLASGQADFPPNDKRKRFFEMVYMLPEEYFIEHKLCIGILGMRRAEFDIMLKRKRKKVKKKEDDSLKEEPTEDDEIKFHFDIPQRIKYITKDAIRSSFTRSRPIRMPLFSRDEYRRRQCETWKRWVTCPNRHIVYNDVTTSSMSHISTTALYL